MKRKRVFRVYSAAFFCLGVLLMGRVCEGMDMQEGEWEISTEVVMEGLAFSMPPTKIRQCLTQQDIVPKQEGEQDKNCVIRDQQVSGDTVKWAVVCQDSSGASEGKGEITYSGKSYQGNMEMTVAEGGEKTQMTMKMSGQYIGPCVK